MYGRKVKGQELNFGVSGMLWNRSLVMYDQETKSLWSHILGEAMAGKLQGATLEGIPAVTTDWKSWKAAHPNTTVLAMGRTSRNYISQFQRRKGAFVLAIVHLGTPRAYPFDLLAEKRVVNDELGKDPVVVTYDAASTQARMFSRKVGKRELTFTTAGEGLMQDRETGSTWNLKTGVCTAGALKDTQLVAMPAIVSFTKAWRVFHPDSSYLE